MLQQNIIHKSRSASQWPNPKVIQKQSFLARKHYKCMTLQQWLTGQLQQCALPSHSTLNHTQWGPCAWGLCPDNIRTHQTWHGDQILFLQMWNKQADIPEWDGMIRIPAQRIRPPEAKGELTVLARGENKEKNCAVNSLWCQGHLTIVCLEHQTLW